MGSRGPMQKPDAVRRGGKPGTSVIEVPEGMVIPDPPKPPKGELLAVVRDAWFTFWEAPVAQLVTPASFPALRRLFLLYDERERAHKSYTAERSATGSMGQAVVSPFAKEVASLDTRILALEDRFGMNPAAQLRLGVALGQAKKALDPFDDMGVWEGGDDGDDPRILDV